MFSIIEVTQQVSTLCTDVDRVPLSSVAIRTHCAASIAAPRCVTQHVTQVRSRRVGPAQANQRTRRLNVDIF